MADETKTDRGNRGSEHAARRCVQERSGQYRRKNRQCRISERADADRRNRDTGDETLGPCGIDQGAAGHLPDQGNESRGGEN
jgi:hypothetical protein